MKSKNLLTFFDIKEPSLRGANSLLLFKIIKDNVYNFLIELSELSKMPRATCHK